MNKQTYIDHPLRTPLYATLLSRLDSSTAFMSSADALLVATVAIICLNSDRAARS